MHHDPRASPKYAPLPDPVYRVQNSHRRTTWARSTTQASRSPHDVHGRCARSRRLWLWKIRSTWQRSSCSLDARSVPTHPFRLVNFA
ncbi:hypothetical protein PLICRDRAFT_611892 [Plicaturopsis crispa FD-325 SS-3]|nr:hypothetical protein PLICRDRAFT_611892 [Plicaturopsis crispa FD-325 SS-3]